MVRKWMKSTIGVLILLAVWQIVSLSGIWSAYVLPSPVKVMKALWNMASTGVLVKHVAISSKRVFLGFGIAFCLAFFGGLVSCLWPKIEEYYGVFLEFMRNVPPISLIALLILWFGIGETSKIIIIVLASFFPMYLNVRKGFVSADKKLLEVGTIFGLNRWQKFIRIVLPAAVPDILVGMRVGLGYSFRAIIGAEMIAASSGLGYMILDAQQMSRSDKVIAGILVIGLCGIVCDQLFRLLMGKTLRKETIRKAVESSGMR